MKKISLFLTFLLMLQIGVQAQDENPKVQLAVRAGLNGSTLLIPKSTIQNESAFGYNSTQKMKLGATAGLVADIRLKEKLYLQTGILYTWQRTGQTQTTQYTDSSAVYHSLTSDNIYTTHHLKVPLMLFYHSSAEKNHFVAGAGIYVDAALAGRITYNGSEVTSSSSEGQKSYIMAGDFNPYTKEPKQIRYSLADDEFINTYPLKEGRVLNRMDFGISMELGYQISQFYIGVHADFGLLNSMNPKFTQHKYVQRNLNFQLMVGYRIN